MTKDEALKLALKALEESLYATTAKSQFLAFEALTAIKEALAQPAQEPDELTIAYMSGLYDGKKKRPWVGLTDVERLHLVNTHVGEVSPSYPLGNDDWINYATAVEAKLKEKNT